MLQKTKDKLSKTLQAAGVASRRGSDQLILNGHVRVNGKVVLKPFQQVSFKEDHIEVNGKKIKEVEEKVYYMLHKPVGYICSSKKLRNEKIVLDLFTSENKKLFTVGRLDKETTGLIILTNDGNFTQKIIHPSAKVKKEYIAKTDSEITEEHLQILLSGMRIEGDFVRPFQVKKVRKGTIKIVLSEGKKHEARLLLAHAGLNCLSLKRVRIGHLHLGDLPEKSFRPLTVKERSEFIQNYINHSN